MAKLYYGRLVPVAFAATTAQAGFPASNLGTPSIGRPWYATGVGANDVTITLAAAAAAPTLELHDVNFAAASIYKSADGVAFNLVGVMQTYYGLLSRRRGKITTNDPAVKAWRISIPAGASTDGLGFWRIGAQHVFGSAAPIGSPFQFSYAIRTVRAQIRTDLANKLHAIARLGNDYQEISVPWQALDSEDIEPVVKQSRAGIVLLDLELPNYPAQLWPVRNLEDDMRESFNQPRTDEVTVTFTEVV